MNPETLTTLEDHFVDKDNQTLHRFFYEHLRELAKTSKTSDEKRSVTANILVKGQISQESFPYKSLALEENILVSDPGWRPKELDEAETVAFQMKIGDKTHKHLKNYCRIFGIRVKKFNESIPKIKVLEKGVLTEKTDPRFKELDLATCFEEVVHKALTEPIERLLGTSAQELFDKEFEEIEKDEKEAQEKAAPKAA